MITLSELKDILADEDPQAIEDLAVKAKTITSRFFGRTISLYAPIYLSNYCDNGCLYCGFRHGLRIKRKKLTFDEMAGEMARVSGAGIQNILLLTGGSRKQTPPSYIKKAVEVAGEYFPSISLEVYPMTEDEYRQLYRSGVDGVTVYQETYNRKRYSYLHPTGKKSDYEYRYLTPERIAKSGIRNISMGALLGLWDVAEDIHELFKHLSCMERNYPGVEYSLSFPRILSVPGTKFKSINVSDLTLIKLMCLARILFPRVGINLSTREGEKLRDHALGIGVTRISAASRTSVGGYTGTGENDTQFDVRDRRSVREVVSILKAKNFDPVFTDWRRIKNGP